MDARHARGRIRRRPVGGHLGAGRDRALGLAWRAQSSAASQAAPDRDQPVGQIALRPPGGWRHRRDPGRAPTHWVRQHAQAASPLSRLSGGRARLLSENADPSDHAHRGDPEEDLRGASLDRETSLRCVRAIEGAGLEGPLLHRRAEGDAALALRRSQRGPGDVRGRSVALRPSAQPQDHRDLHRVHEAPAHDRP